MAYSFFVFVLLVILSGGIAYIGDYIGRYLGKKRLSFFGLRPKHTAIVSTVITGMLISFLVLLVVTCVNREFREVLLHGKQIMEKNEKLAKKTNEMLYDNKLLEKSNNILKTEHNKLNKKFLSLEKLTDIIENKNAVLSKKAKEYEEKSEKLSKKSSDLEKNIRKLLSDYDQNLKKLDVSEKAKKTAEENIIKYKNDLEVLKAEYVSLTEKNDNMGLLLLEKQTDLDNTEKKYSEQTENLKNIENQLAEAKNNLDATLKYLEAANQELQTYTELRLNDVIIRQDDEFIRSSIDKNTSEREIGEIITNLYIAADKRCKKIVGQVTDKNKGMILGYKSETGEILLGEEDELLEKAAELIAENRKRQTLIIISSAGNFTKKDLETGPVITQIKIYEDVLLYKSGESVLRKIFDGKMTEPYVFYGVNDFINQELSNKVLNKGLMYYQKPMLLKDPESAVRNIENQLSLTKKIKTLDKMCLIEVKAKKNIYSHDIYSSDLFDYDVRMLK